MASTGNKVPKLIKYCTENKKDGSIKCEKITWTMFWFLFTISGTTSIWKNGDTLYSACSLLIVLYVSHWLRLKFPLSASQPPVNYKQVHHLNNFVYLKLMKFIKINRKWSRYSMHFHHQSDILKQFKKVSFFPHFYWDYLIFILGFHFSF